MNDENLLSFCIPVYNAEKYIQPCIDSIIKQNLSNYEIICIDDCSTDGSFEILQQIAMRHPQVIILRNETNKGMSYSRNIALKKAKGQYVWFVDVDDLLVEKVASLYLQVAVQYNAKQY